MSLKKEEENGNSEARGITLKRRRGRNVRIHLISMRTQECNEREKKR